MSTNLQENKSIIIDESSIQLDFTKDYDLSNFRQQQQQQQLDSIESLSIDQKSESLYQCIDEELLSSMCKVASNNKEEKEGERNKSLKSVQSGSVVGCAASNINSGINKMNKEIHLYNNNNSNNNETTSSLPPQPSNPNRRSLMTIKLPSDDKLGPNNSTIKASLSHRQSNRNINLPPPLPPTSIISNINQRHSTILRNSLPLSSNESGNNYYRSNSVNYKQMNPMKKSNSKCSSGQLMNGVNINNPTTLAPSTSTSTSASSILPNRKPSFKFDSNILNRVSNY
jgi:hypothetical protein